MKRWLYLTHRWAGIALALFMFIWFSSGLAIMYAGPSALSPIEQLSYRDNVQPHADWKSLGEAWQISLHQRAQMPARIFPDKAPPTIAGENDWVQSARLVSLAGEGYWLVENGQGQRFALSAEQGTLHRFSVEDAAKIANGWLTQEQRLNNEQIQVVGSPFQLNHVDTGPQDSSVRNYDALRPFHRFSVGDTGRELLISERTGEVVRDSTPAARALFWIGNWIHLLRPVETLFSADARRNTLLWLGVFAFAAGLTGLIIGWQRWRPGWFGGKTYSQGRVHPYRDVWNTLHFWVGLIGGIAAVLWAFSGTMNSNPFQVFSANTPSKPELSRYQGISAPATLWAWQPGSVTETLRGNEAFVEFSWQRVGDAVALIGVTRTGERTAQTIDGAQTAFSESLLIEAAQRFSNGKPVAAVEWLNEYDSYYYPRHHQSLADRPLPVARIDLADDAGTQLYIDPQDARIVLKQDTSRRAYRWLYSALHHWDFGWLYYRPIWDAWMLPLVLMGIVLGFTSIVLGWKRLQIEFKPKKKKSAAASAKRPKKVNVPLAPELPAS